jgi:prepilin-type N-terminal cleavage/methylation domain-containing protein
MSRLKINNSKGFSLIEVMASLSIFAIVMAGAVPAFILNLKYNTLSELRSSAAIAAQLKLGQLRFEDPQDMPSSGTSASEDVEVGSKTFQVTTSYCANATYCTTINNRHITVNVSYHGNEQYSVQTVFTKLR